MITKKVFAVAALALTLVLAGVTSASAQTTTYTPPAGYAAVINGPAGVYYNPSTGMYFYSGNNVFTTTAPTIPAGYQPYAYGTYYNSTNGQYYNPMTGQYSTMAPLGPAQRDANGNWIIPGGYTRTTSGTYYNSTTGYYYDPFTGIYSTTAPQGTMTTTGSIVYPGGSWMPNLGGTGTVVYTPGFPNTGAGGDAGKVFALLVMCGLLAATGVTVLGKKVVQE